MRFLVVSLKFWSFFPTSATDFLLSSQCQSTTHWWWCESDLKREWFHSTLVFNSVQLSHLLICTFCSNRSSSKFHTNTTINTTLLIISWITNRPWSNRVCLSHLNFFFFFCIAATHSGTWSPMFAIFTYFFSIGFLYKTS